MHRTGQTNQRYTAGGVSSLSRALLDAASEYEAKNNRDRNLLVRRIASLTEEKRELEESVVSLRSECAAEKEAKLNAEGASEKFQLAADEATAALKIERCRVLGALLIIADLRKGPPAIAEEKHQEGIIAPTSSILTEEKEVDEDSLIASSIRQDEILGDEEHDNISLEEEMNSITKKKSRGRRGGRKKHRKKEATTPNSEEEITFPRDDDDDDETKQEDKNSKSNLTIKIKANTAYGLALNTAKRLEPRSAMELIDACSQGKTSLFQSLLEPKSELHTQSDDILYDTAEAVLSQALDRASRGGYLRTCNILIHAGARAERTCCDPAELEEPLLCHFTESESESNQEAAAPALHAAIAGGHDDVVKMLVTHGASANAVAATGGGGSTPLHICAAHNRPQLAHFLIAKANARLETFDDSGRTPLQVANEHRWHAVSKVLKDPGVVFWARANRANRLCKEGEHILALESFELALAELEKLKKNQSGPFASSINSNGKNKSTGTTSKMPTSATIMTLHNNRAKSLMACGQHLAARSALDAAFADVSGDALTYLAPFAKRCECHAKLLDHDKAADGYEQLLDRYENTQNDHATPEKIQEWRQAAIRERAKLKLEPHELLGVSADADLSQVKQAYRRLSLKNHPDRHASSTPEHKYRAHLQFQRVSAAYEKMLATVRLRDLRSSWGKTKIAHNFEDDDDGVNTDDDDYEVSDDNDDVADDDEDLSSGFWRRYEN
mmetsp:Transcript_13951/g.20971  ORF Transcript_13951/g.20971 Transcript_13951/m.20971 type:complete len:729 (+) Transcript_13951:57-2243(+)